MNRQPYFSGPPGGYYPPADNYYSSDYYSQPDYYSDDSFGASASYQQPPNRWDGQSRPPPPPFPPPPPPPPPPPIPQQNMPAPPPSRIRSLFDSAPLPGSSAMDNQRPMGQPAYFGSWDERSVGYMDPYSGGYVGSHDGFGQPSYGPAITDWSQESDFVGDSWSSMPPYGGADRPYQYGSGPGMERNQQFAQNVQTAQARERYFPSKSTSSQSPSKPKATQLDKTQTDVQDMELDASGESAGPSATESKVLEEEEEDEDHWRRCDACDVNFDTEAAYSRHCRGLIHTQKLLERSTTSTSASETPASTTTQTSSTKPEGPDTSSEKKTPVQRPLLPVPFPTSGCLVDPEKRDLRPNDVGKQREDLIYCEVCKISCSSEGAMQAHLDGKKHQKVLRMTNWNSHGKEQNGFLRGANAVPVNPRRRDPSDGIISHETFLSRGESHSTEDTGKVAFIQAKIDSFPEPLIGLKFLVEYVMNDYTEPRYVCNLCEAKCDPRTVISHLTGYKHRLKYLKDIRSDIYAEIQLAPSDAMARDLLREKAAELEKLEGRAKIRQKCDTSLIGVIDELKPHTSKVPRINRTPSSVSSRFRAGDSQSRISNGEEEYFQADTAEPSYACEETVEKSDYPYYSIRASRGHVRITDETDDFYALEQGYYYLRWERNHTRYDELYVKPFIGVKRKQASTSGGSGLLGDGSSGSKTNDTMKVLMAALAKVSSGSTKNGELTLALSTTLTKALISFKEKKKAEEAKRLEEEAKRRAEELAAPKVQPDLVPIPRIYRPPSPEPYALLVPSTRHRLAVSPTRHPMRTTYMDDELETIMAVHAQSQRRRAAAEALAAPPPPKKKLGAGYSS